MAGYGSRRTADDNRLKALHDKPLFEPAYAMRRALKLLEFCRQELGDEVELLHDMHERLTPNQAVQFCKEAEQFQYVLPGRPAFAGGPGLLPADPSELRHAHRHGRAFQQPA